METFFSLLERHVQTQDTLLCVGLDPHPADLPAPTADAALAHCLRIVQQTARYAAAFKPNAAFFEVYGAAGWTALKQLVEAIRAESQRLGSVIPVILDAKRGDIASTAEAYAQAAFQTLGAHALTVSPYLGQDSITPFTADRERGVFLLCKTSNAGSGDLQDVALAEGGTLYERVARLAQSWNQNGNVGLVAGATHPEALARIRAAAPGLWCLVPGVGAQGGDLAQALAAGLRADGQGLLINASRSIARAANPKDEARRLRDEINALRRAQPARKAASPLTALAQDLVASQCVKFGAFTLKSGRLSPIYLDLRRLVSQPALLRRAAQAYAEVLQRLSFDRLAGLPYAALPIGTAVALEMGRPLLYPRREVKEYGTRAAIEGDYQAGETIAVIDDLATTGDTKIEAIQKLEAAGLKVRDIVVLIDREQGAKEMLAAAGYRLHAVATLRELLEVWRATAAITPAQFDEVQAFLNAG